MKCVVEHRDNIEVINSLNCALFIIKHKTQ
jgi:hypothetical protein